MQGQFMKFPNFCFSWDSSTSYWDLSSSKYSPVWLIHFCQRRFHCLKHSWKAVSFISLIVINHYPFIDFNFGNKKKHAGAKSGEYGGRGSPVKIFFTQKSRINSDVCAGALSWRRNHEYSSTFHPVFSSSQFLGGVLILLDSTISWQSVLPVKIRDG